MGLIVVCEKRPALASADKEDLEHSGRDRKWQLSVSSVCPEMAEYHQLGVFHFPLDTVIPARGCKGRVKRIPNHTLSFYSTCCFRWSGWSPQRTLRTESSHLRVFFLAQLVPSCPLMGPVPFPLGMHSRLSPHSDSKAASILLTSLGPNNSRDCMSFSPSQSTTWKIPPPSLSFSMVPFFTLCFLAPPCPSSFVYASGIRASRIPAQDLQSPGL